MTFGPNAAPADSTQQRLYLGINTDLNELEAISLAVTFDKDQIESSCLGSVVVNELGNQFEIEEVTQADIMLYQGYASLLELSSELLISAKKLSKEDIQNVAEGKYSEHFSEILDEIQGALDQIKDPLSILKRELASSGVEKFLAKQEVLVQIGIPSNLLEISVIFSEIMKNHWKKKPKLLSTQSVRESTGSLISPADRNEAADTFEEFNTSEDDGDDSETDTVTETESMEDEDDDMEDEIEEDDRFRNLAMTIKMMKKPARSFFDESLEIIFETLKSNRTNCKMFIKFDRQFHQIFEVNRQLVGTILAELYTYTFPDVDNIAHYYDSLMDHFDKITQENIKDQHLFTRIVRILMDGDTYESDLFHNYCYHVVTKYDLDIISYKFLKLEKRLWITFELVGEYYTYEQQSIDNPVFAEAEKKEVEGRLYYAVDQIRDQEYIEYIKQCMLYSCIFKNAKIGELMQKWNGVTSLLLVDIIYMTNVSLSIKYGAVIMYDRLISLLRAKSSKYIFNISSGKSFSYSGSDMIRLPADSLNWDQSKRDAAIQDLRHAARMTLYLGATSQTMQLFLPTSTLPEKIRFSTGLLRLSYRLISDAFATKEYIRATLAIVKIALAHISKRPDLPTNWFSSMITEAAKASHKDFEVKTVIEVMYDWVFKVLNACIQGAIAWQFEYFVDILRQPYSMFRAKQLFTWEPILQRIANEIVNPLEVFIWEKGQMSNAVVRRTLSMVAVSPLPAAEIFDKEVFYSLSEFRFSIHTPMLDILDGLFIESVSFGINFDRKLITVLQKAVNLRQTIGAELEKLIIVDETTTEIANMVDRCYLNLNPTDIADMSFGSPEGRISGVTRVTETIKRHPFLSAANAMQSKDTLKVLQMLTSLNQEDLDFFAYFFQQLREIEQEKNLTVEQKVEIHSARAVSMKFLLGFIRSNMKGKKEISKWLKPSDLAFLIQEVAEFAMEFAAFDYLSTKETQIVFKSLKQNLQHDDYWKAHQTYKFMQLIAEVSESEAQNLVVSTIGESVKKRLKQIENKEQLSEAQLRYVELSLMFLSDCSKVNRIARNQVVTLLTLRTLHELFSHRQSEFSLLLALLTFIDRNFRKDIQVNAIEIVGSVLQIAIGILSQGRELLDVINLNVYREVPHKTMVSHSGLRLTLTPAQRITLAKLRFIFWKSQQNEYGVLVAVPNILRRVAKHYPTERSQISRFVTEFQTIKRLVSELDISHFDFSLLRWRTNKALQTMNLLISNNVTKKDNDEEQFGERESSSLLKETFIEKLAELFPSLTKSMKTTRLVDSLAVKIQGYLLAKQDGKAEEALATLYHRRPQLPLKTFSRVLVRICKNIQFPWTKNLLRILIRNNTIFDIFSMLGDVVTLRTNIALLWAINSLLRNQAPETIQKLKTLLVGRSLDTDILVMIQKEVKQALETSRQKESGEPLASYINSLSYLRYQTYGDDYRRQHLIEMHQKLVISLMKLMQRMCDNCNELMQDYVRVQKENYAFNINLVETMNDFLVEACMMAKDESLMTNHTLDYLTTAINTLIEFATGPCKENQSYIGKSILLYLSLNKLMQLPPEQYYDFSSRFRTAESDTFDDNITDLRASVTKLLTVLLEGDPEEKSLELIDKYLDKRVLINHAKKVYTALSRSRKREVETEDPSAVHITKKVKTVLQEVCFLISFLQKFHDKPLSSLLLTEDDQIPFRNFYLNYVGYVEVDMNPEVKAEDKKSEDIRDVFFVIPFKAKFLPKQSAEEVITEVSHESLQERKEGFLKSVRMRKREMEHHQRIARRVVLQYIISQSYNLKLLSFLIVIAINIALFVDNDKELLRGSGYSSATGVIFALILGVIQLVCNALGAILNSIDSYTKIVDKYTAEDEGMDFEDLAFENDRESQRAIYLKLTNTEIEVKPVAHNEDVKQRILKGPPASWQALVLYTENIAALVSLATSIAALIYPMLYPLLLLQIFDHVSQLTVILQAITYNKSQLIYTALFGVHLLLLFSIIAFVWFSVYFNWTEGSSLPIIFCDSLWDCFTSTVHWGLLSGGGLGDAMGAATQGRYWGRLVYDLIFFIVIIIIMLNIIFGIIIDTFGELREKRNAVEADINSICFICGTDRNEIELHGLGWAYHFQNEHSPYAYLAFFVYLTDMRGADCSGVEKTAKFKLIKTDISFIPDTSKMLVQSKIK